MAVFHAGDLFEGYRLESLLGQGGFGAVWRVTHVETGVTRALKFLSSPTIDRDQLMRRADVELLAASASSRSPHVVRVFDGSMTPEPYVVMEYVQGTDLATELQKRGRIRQAEAIRIGQAVAGALGALAEMGIIHRDVKPANIMIDEHDVVKLMDFGIAKIVGTDSITAAGSPMTFTYAAPEVWEGKATYASDFYALGVVLYEALVGVPPFRGTAAEIFRKHADQVPDLEILPESTVPALRELIGRCLEKLPEDRPSGAPECLAMLSRAVDEVSSPSAATEQETHEPVRFGPWVRGAVTSEGPWSWHAMHETTGEPAVVDVLFSEELAFGETLRQAVAQNDRLTRFGGERLLGSSRLLRRPDEAWSTPTFGRFEFWLARSPSPPSTELANPTLLQLQQAVSVLGALQSAALSAGLPLSLTGENLVLHEDGAPYVFRPGLPGPGAEDPAAAGLERLREITTDPDLLEALKSSTDFGEAAFELSLLTRVMPTIVSASEPQEAETVIVTAPPQVSSEGDATTIIHQPQPDTPAETLKPVPVGLVPRVIGFILDYLPAALFPFLVLVIVEGMGIAVEQNDEITALGWVLLCVSWIAYFAVFWAGLAGTPAMRFLGMRVVNAQTGEKVSIQASILRSIVFTAGLFALGLGSLWALWDPKRQTLQDKAAGTMIVWSGSGAVKVFGQTIWQHPKT